MSAWSCPPLYHRDGPTISLFHPEILSLFSRVFFPFFTPCKRDIINQNNPRGLRWSSATRPIPAAQYILAKD